MKKIMKKIAALVLGALIVAPAYAGMDDVVYTLPVIGSAASSTNSATYVVRGQIEGIYVDFTTGCTGTVTVASDRGQTIFSKATITTDTAYYPRTPVQNYAGTAMSLANNGTNGADGVGTTIVPSVWEKFAVAGDVTVTVVGETATVTNSAVITLIVNE